MKEKGLRFFYVLAVLASALTLGAKGCDATTGAAVIADKDGPATGKVQGDGSTPDTVILEFDR